MSEYRTTKLKDINTFPIEIWPLLAAISFISKHGQAHLRLLTNAESFNHQMKEYAGDYSLEQILETGKTFDFVSLKEVEAIFEQSLDSLTRKTQGAVYTPDFIIDYILAQVVDKNALPTPDEPLLDPACGSGGFLVRAAKLLSSYSGESFAQSTSCVCGIDINPKAIANAALLLDLASISENMETSQARLVNCDSLLTPISEQLHKLNISSGVRALATNPPYVKLQTLEEEYSNALSVKYEEIAGGAFSLASLFLFNSTKYLVDEGKAGLITLNNIFTSLAAKKQRDLWVHNKNIFKIIDFRHFAVFNASAYTCLIFLDKNSHENIQYNAVSEKPTSLSLSNLNSSAISYSLLDPFKWRLASSSVLSLIHAMESKGNQLKSISDIKVGFATLLDKAFIGESRNSEIFVKGFDGVERIIERGATEPFYKVSDFKNANIVDTDLRYVIYPYDRNDTKRPLINRSEFMEKYPITARHLNSWKGRLESRELPDAKEWHQWGRRQSLIALGPKLLTKTFDLKPTFRLDESDSLFCNGYSVKPKVILEGYSLEHIKYFLESRFVHAYALVTSFEIAGGYQCYQKNFIEKICLPPRLLIENTMQNEIEFEREVAKFYGVSLLVLNECLEHYLG